MGLRAPLFGDQHASVPCSGGDGVGTELEPKERPVGRGVRDGGALLRPTALRHPRHLRASGYDPKSGRQNTTNHVTIIKK